MTSPVESGSQTRESRRKYKPRELNLDTVRSIERRVDEVWISEYHSGILLDGIEQVQESVGSFYDRARERLASSEKIQTDFLVKKLEQGQTGKVNIDPFPEDWLRRGTTITVEPQLGGGDKYVLSKLDHPFRVLSEGQLAADSSHEHGLLYRRIHLQLPHYEESFAIDFDFVMGRVSGVTHNLEQSHVVTPETTAAHFMNYSYEFPFVSPLSLGTQQELEVLLMLDRGQLMHERFAEGRGGADRINQQTPDSWKRLDNIIYGPFRAGLVQPSIDFLVVNSLHGDDTNPYRRQPIFGFEKKKNAILLSQAIAASFAPLSQVEFPKSLERPRAR